MFLKDTGHHIEDEFDDFQRTPIGAASLAQVHTAILKKTGQKVAVKVQHPVLEDFAAVDLALTSFTFATLKKFFPEYDLSWLSNEMEESLPKELDFALEGENAIRAKKYFKENTSAPLIIPDGKDRCPSYTHAIPLTACSNLGQEADSGHGLHYRSSTG